MDGAASIADLAETFREAHAGKALDPRLELTLDRVGELVGEMMDKESKRRPDARRVAQRLSEIENNFSNERTQAGYVMPESGPIQLTTPRRSSTMVLPRRAGKAGVEGQTTSKTLEAAMPRSRGGRGVLIGLGLGVAVLLTGGVWVATRPPPPEQKDPPVVVPPQPPAPKVVEVIDAGVAPVAMVAEQVDAGDEELVGLPNPPPAVVAKKDAGTKKVAPQVASCTPDAMWKKTMKKDVGALRQRASALDAKRFLEWEADERTLLIRVDGAQTSADCAAADAQLTRMLAKY